MNRIEIDLDLGQGNSILDILVTFDVKPQHFAGLIYDLFYRVWSYDLLLEHRIPCISTHSGWFYVELSKHGLC